MCGGGPRYPEPLTAEQMAADTDNPYENPGSGVAAPDWKPEDVKKEKEARAAKKAAEKAAAAEAAARARAKEEERDQSSGSARDSQADRQQRKDNRRKAKENYNNRRQKGK